MQQSMFITIAAAIGVGVIVGVAAIIIHDLIGNVRRMARLGRSTR